MLSRIWTWVILLLGTIIRDSLVSSIPLILLRKNLGPA